MQRKFSDIFSLSFAIQKFPPSGEQICHRNDIIVSMAQSNSSLSLSLSLDKCSILVRIKEGYLLWMNIVPHITKNARFTIGARIENKFLDLLDLTYIAYFSGNDGKTEKVTECILILDLLKYLMSVAWEGRVVSVGQYEEISKKLNEIGRMFGGWLNSLKNPDKKNRTV
jgi:hypothetical protein